MSDLKIFCIDSTMHDHNRKVLILVPPDFRSWSGASLFTLPPSQTPGQTHCVWLI